MDNIKHSQALLLKRKRKKRMTTHYLLWCIPDDPRSQTPVRSGYTNPPVPDLCLVHPQCLSVHLGKNREVNHAYTTGTS